LEEKKASIGRLSVEVQEGSDAVTREDTDNLFKLLAIFRPNDPRAEDTTLKSAWALVLEPYAVEDVRAAVAAYFREKKFWPDVTDISSRCPPLPQMPHQPPPLTGGYIDHAVEALRERWQELRRQCRAAGVPGTWEDAKKAGLTWAAWMDILDERGLAL